jgi:hypothetical protein
MSLDLLIIILLYGSVMSSVSLINGWVEDEFSLENGVKEDLEIVSNKFEIQLVLLHALNNDVSIIMVRVGLHKDSELYSFVLELHDLFLIFLFELIYDFLLNASSSNVTLEL